VPGTRGEVDQLRGQPVDRGGFQAVVGEAAVWLTRDQTGLPQHAQVVADVGLAGAGQLDEVACAQLLDGEQLDDPGT